MLHRVIVLGDICQTPLYRDAGVVFMLDAKVQHLFPEPPVKVIGSRDVRGNHLVGEAFSDDLIGQCDNITVTLDHLRTDRFVPTQAKSPRIDGARCILA